jgi:hypothetical protein
LKFVMTEPESTDGHDPLMDELMEKLHIGSTGTGLLDAIHQRWLESTEGGNNEFIVSRIQHEIASGQPDEEVCVELLEGYIARIGERYLGESRTETDVYLTGRRAVQSYFAANLSTEPAKISVQDVLSAIEAGYEPAELPEQSPDSQPLEALDIANHRKSEVAKIRAGLREGKISLAEALSSPFVATITIDDILIRVPHVGKVKRRRALAILQLAGETEIGTLTNEHKAQLAGMFPPEKYRPLKRKRPTATSQSRKNILRQGSKGRIYRAGLKRKLAAGQLSVEELLDDSVGAGMKVGELLVRLPTITGTTPKNVRSHHLRNVVLSETGLSGSKRCNQLTERQRKLLLDCLAVRYKKETGTYSAARMSF